MNLALWIGLIVAAFLIIFLIKKVTKLLFKIGILVLAFVLALYVYNNYIAVEDVTIPTPDAEQPQLNVTSEMNASVVVRNISEQAELPQNLSSSND